MQDFFKSFFKTENIDCFASLPISTVQPHEIVSPRRLPDFAKTCIVFLVPYFIDDCAPRNISLYAVSRDYHHYVKQLESRFAAFAKERNVGINAKMFADTSPFDERSLAARCGLGFVGKSGILINPVYGSFVFIAELVIDTEVSLNRCTTKETACLGCGKCKKSCPSGCLSGSTNECMSHITQKKNITEDEAALIKNHPLVWGCDICQEVCPHNAGAHETPIAFFRENRLPLVSMQTLDSMNETEFSLRAYSWRGRGVIERNILLHNRKISSD